MIGQSVYAQRVIGYYQGWRQDYGSIQYDKVTDLNYSFALPNSNGTIYFVGTEKNDVFAPFVSYAKAQGVRVNLSIGGASKAAANAFQTIGSNTNTAKTFAQNAVQLALDYNLDGIDIDWEPVEEVNATAFTNLLKELRAEINASAPHVELTAAVFPYQWQNEGVKPESYQYVDHFNLMVYDFGGAGYQHHSPYDVAPVSVNHWVGKGLDKSKMVLGLPFYGRSANWGYDQDDFKLYKDIINNDNGRAQLDSYGGWYYNGIPTIKQKTEYAMDQSLKGVMFWEISADATGSNSLLSAIDEVISTGCQRPSLQEDQTICGITSVELDGVLDDGQFNYKWYLDGNVISGATSRKYTATEGGTYKVETTSKTNDKCVRTASVTLETTIPTPDLGSDIPLCGTETVDIDATVSIPNLNYSWNDGTNGAQIGISQPGNYTVTISDPKGHCPSVQSSISADNTELTVEDGKACMGDEATLKVLSAGGPYTWFEQETGGELLGVGSEFNVTVESPSKSYYVQKTGGALTEFLGLKDKDEFPGEFDGYITYTADKYMVFNVTQEITIDSVTIYGDFANSTDVDNLYYGEGGTIVINIRDSGGQLVGTSTFEYDQDGGEFRIPVGITVLPGNGYTIDLDGSNVAIFYSQVSNKQPSDDGYKRLPYPFDFEGIMQIKTAYAGAGGPWEDVRTYPGIYNWRVSTGATCPRVEVKAIEDASLCANEDPTVTITAPNDGDKVTEGDDVSITFDANDPEGNIASIEVTVDGNVVSNNGSSASWTADKLGDIIIEVTVTDDQGATASDQITITVEEKANLDPTVTITAPKDGDKVTEGDDVSITFNADDQDGTIANIEVTVDGNVVSNNGSSATWTADKLGDIVIEVTVTDNKGATASDQITITVEEKPNVDPTVTITAPNDGDDFILSDVVNITYSSNDTDGSVVSTEVSIDGNVISDNASSTSWTSDKTGTVTIKVTVTDNRGGTASDQINIVVNDPANELPVVDITAPNNGDSYNEGDVVSITFSASDPNGSIVSTGLKVGSATVSVTDNGDGTYSATWTADQTGAVVIEASATDDNNATTKDQITINVAEDMAPEIVITSPSNGADFMEGDVVSIEFTATDDLSTLNPVLTVDGNTVSTSQNGNTYTATWTADKAGSIVIEVSASDDKGQTATESVTINVEGDEAPTVSITAPSSGSPFILGDDVSISFNASDDVAIASVELTVDGQVVSHSGNGNYTATWNADMTGSIDIVVTVEDSKGQTATDQVSITVNEPANENPTVSIDTDLDTYSLGDDVQISWTANDPDGTITSIDVQVDGSTVATSGDEFTWTSDHAGSIVVSITVTDNKGATASDQKTITVNDPSNNNPTVSINTDLTTYNEGDDVLITWSANDTDGNIASIDVKVDGSTVATSGDQFTWTANATGSIVVSITVTDNKGATASDQVTITVNSGTNGSVSLTANQVGDSQVDLSISGVDASNILSVQYIVTDADGNVIDQKNKYLTDADPLNHSWYINHTGEVTIKAVVNYLDSTPSETSNEVTMSVQRPLGVGEELLSALDMNVFPNPATEYVNMSYNLDRTAEVAIEVYTMDGVKVATLANGTQSAGTYNLDANVAEMNKGIYFIQVKIDEHAAVRKLVVE